MKKVVCLMPTYGRFQMALRATSHFLKQTYQNKELVIFNQGAPMTTTLPQVKIVNTTRQYEGLGEIYASALQHCDGDLINMWDDDDGRFPWFLESTIAGKVKRAAKSEESWVWMGKKLFLGNNVLEPSWVIDLDVIRAVGFDNAKTFVHMKWVRWCIDHGEVNPIPVETTPGFIYVWGESRCHSSATRDQDVGFANFRKYSDDFGDGLVHEIDVNPWYDRITQEHPGLRAKLGLNAESLVR